MTALAANKARHVRATEHMTLRQVTTGASFTAYRGGLVNFNASGNAVAAADTSGHRIAGVIPFATESSPGVQGAIASGVSFNVEVGHEEWFPLGGSTAFDGADLMLDACVFDTGSVATGGETTNDVRVGRIVQLETINGVAGVWVHVGVFGTAATA